MLPVVSLGIDLIAVPDPLEFSISAAGFLFALDADRYNQGIDQRKRRNERIDKGRHLAAGIEPQVGDFGNRRKGGIGQRNGGGTPLLGQTSSR